MYLRILLTICCFIVGWSASAYNLDETSIARLSIADGLTGETVNRFTTDHSGIIWIATNGGVNVYNGKKLHSFPIIGKDRQPLEVYDICEVGSTSIYAATSEGVWQLEFGNGQFERVCPEIQQAVCLMSMGDTLLIGGLQGISIYHAGRLTNVSVGVSHHGLDNIVRQYVKEEDGSVWFLGRYDLNKLDTQTGKVSRYNLHLPEVSALTQFVSLGNGRFIVGTRGNGLYDCNLQTGTAVPIKGVGKIVMSVQLSPDGYVCVGTDGAGAYQLRVLHEGLEVVNRFSTEGDSRHLLPSNGIYCYYRDANGVNWFGFVRYGMVYSYHSGNLFKPFQAGDFTSEGINVRTFCFEENHLVIGTQSGFYYVDKQQGLKRYFSPADLGGANIVNTICRYKDCFYIGSFDGGLYRFDPTTMKVEPQQFSPMLENASIGDLKVDSEGRLWIGSSQGLMIIADGQLLQHFTEQNSPIISGLILSITFDRQGNAWLTGKGGCSIYSRSSRSIVKTEFPKGFFNTIPWMKGAQGHDGHIFFRTGPQLFYTNEGMTDFGEINFPVSFKDKWCRSFVDDMHGYYALASERGVFSANYKLEELRQFGYGEGLYGDFINDISYADNLSLWVATSQGLYYADHQVIFQWGKANTYKTNLQNIRRGSALMDYKAEYLSNANRTIQLSWNISSEVLQAEPFLQDYSKSKGRIYEYCIDGGEWQYASDGSSILVEGLYLGQHRLYVRQAGCSGTQSVFTVMVYPSNWALVEFIFLLLSIVLLWLWWRFRKNTKVLLTERDEIEDALIESEELRVKSEESLNKYDRVKIDDDECSSIVKRMREYIERERVYTDADLKMKDIAEVLHLSAPKLSQVFNLYLGQNYYDFINGYRLNEFKRLIAQGEYKRYTITALSEQCGFKKSNFFSTFRKVEGMTPTEYLKKKGIKLG